MNEQNRYRGSGSPQGQSGTQQGQNRERSDNEWQRDYGRRQQRSEPDYPRRNEFADEDRSGQADRPFREQDRDYRASSTGYSYGQRRDPQQRDPQYEWSGSGFASGSGSSGGEYGAGSGYGSGSGYQGEGESGDEYRRERGYGSGGGYTAGNSYGTRNAYGAGAAWQGRSEIPWSGRSEFYYENRGASGPAYGHSSNPNSIANFGDRTRESAAGSRASFAGRGPKGYARSDERIREDVCERLSENDEVDASDVEVTVSDREVTLTGTVETRRMKHLAEDIADSISGVEDVHNRITVRKPFLKDIADRLLGDEPVQHHANTGTKTTAASTSSTAQSVTPHMTTPVANGGV